MERTLGGYFMLQDPMSAYYETLCTGMDWIDDINMEELGADNQNNSGWLSSNLIYHNLFI